MFDSEENEFDAELKMQFSIDPDLVRLRQGTGSPSWLRKPILAPYEVRVLFVAQKPERIDSLIHRQMMDQYHLLGVSATTFLGKYTGYMMPHERAASSDYVRMEIIHYKPQIIVALGSEALTFCVRPKTAKESLPPVSVCHGKRFATPNGKPVIAGLPPTVAFARTRVALAYEAAAYTLKNLNELEFS